MFLSPGENKSSNVDVVIIIRVPGQASVYNYLHVVEQNRDPLIISI